ncbi:MAG TPA: ubiquinone/menaquinone biosynthesis methyltransferase [Dehalococcoidia bacterium]|nr:ubiquinone/menaquinone biosynthesis methyltransferase [Dehalococcoidia bacterium]
MAVQRRYDLINRLFTWGLDERWRRQAARECLKERPEQLLDLCCGTAGLALRLVGMSSGSTMIVGIDFSLPMLEIAREKAKHASMSERVALVHGDTAALPFPDGHFDCIGISFAFRNLTYKNPLALRYLNEVLRVLRPGGRFVLVESSQPTSRLIRKLFHLYMRWYVSRLGHLLSGNRGAYRYLAESASRFYTAEELRNLMLEVGFSKFSSRRLALGTVAIHVATK